VTNSFLGAIRSADIERTSSEDHRNFLLKQTCGQARVGVARSGESESRYSSSVKEDHLHTRHRDLISSAAPPVFGAFSGNAFYKSLVDSPLYLARSESPHQESTPP